MKTLLRILSTWIVSCAANAATITGGSTFDPTSAGAVTGTTLIGTTSVTSGTTDGRVVTTSVSGYPGIWMSDQAASPSLTNYAILQDKDNNRLYLNAPLGSTINFMLDNAVKWNLDTTGNLLATGAMNITTTGIGVVGKLRVTAPTVPASAAAAGTAGDIAWDADFIYVCTATNTWKRVAIATW